MKKGMARRGNFSKVPKKMEETPESGIRSKNLMTNMLDNPRDIAMGMSKIKRAKKRMANNNPGVMISFLLNSVAKVE